MKNFQFGSTILPSNKVHFIDEYVNVEDKNVFKILEKMNFKGFNSFITRLEHDYQTHFFFVGGCVRDLFLGKEPKDIDIIIPHIDVDELALLLSVYGDVDLVGKSFGVLKFKPFGLNDTIDVSVPRIERSTGEKHTDFEIIAKTHVTLEEDLKRRDFTMNALAMTHSGYIFDPFDGIKDIQEREIRTITENSFIDDPLRMLRALQFSARFGFIMAEETIDSFINNVELIKNISGERILTELEKGITGDVFKFGTSLWNFGAWTAIFGDKAFIDNSQALENVRTIAELLFVGEITPQLAEEKIKISAATKKELQALWDISTLCSMEMHAKLVGCENEGYKKVFSAIQKAPQTIETKIFYGNEHWFEPFLSGEFPKSFKELAVNGDDVMKFGFVGEQVGKILRWLLDLIFSKSSTNEKGSLLEALNYLKNISQDYVKLEGKK